MQTLYQKRSKIPFRAACEDASLTPPVAADISARQANMPPTPRPGLPHAARNRNIKSKPHPHLVPTQGPCPHPPPGRRASTNQAWRTGTPSLLARRTTGTRPIQRALTCPFPEPRSSRTKKYRARPQSLGPPAPPLTHLRPPSPMPPPTAAATMTTTSLSAAPGCASGTHRPV